MKTTVALIFAIVAFALGGCGGQGSHQAHGAATAPVRRSASAALAADYGQHALLFVRYCAREISHPRATAALRSRAYAAADHLRQITDETPNLLMPDGRTIAENTSDLRVLSGACDDTLTQHLTGSTA